MIFVVFFISFLQFELSSSLVMHVITAFIFICFFFVLSIIIYLGQFVPNLRDKRLKEYRNGLPAVGRLSSGGGGTQQMFTRGGFAPKSNPLPFYIPFFTKKVPSSYTFYGQTVPLSHTLFRTLHSFKLQ